MSDRGSGVSGGSQASSGRVRSKNLFVRWIGTSYSAEMLGEFEDALKVATKDATYYGRHESLSDGSYRIAVVFELAKRVNWKDGRTKLLFAKDGDGVSIVVETSKLGKDIYQAKVECGECFEDGQSVSNVVMFGRKSGEKAVVRKRKNISGDDNVDAISTVGSKKSRKSKDVLQKELELVRLRIREKELELELVAVEGEEGSLVSETVGSVD